MMRRQIASHSPEDTAQLGLCLGRLLDRGQVIALFGELGAGKTALSKGIARGLGITTPVTSPTFTLVNEYTTPSGAILAHVDLYRLGEIQHEAVQEATAFGLDELLDASGDDAEQVVVLIEWAQRVTALLPEDHLTIHLAAVDGAEESRQIELVAYGPHSARLLARLRDATGVGA